jgi:regulator of sigma E protease
MNILLAFLLFSLTFMVPHDVVSGQVVVIEVAPGSPAAAAGIEPGDTVLSINDRPISNIAELSRYVQLNLGRDTTMVVRHGDSTTEEIQLVPRWKPPEGQGATGITISMPEATVTRQHYPFWKAIPMGAKGLIETIILYKNGLVGMVMGALPAELIGPVGIAQITGEVAIKAGISPLLEFAAFISLILGILNLFPLPALDGGRIAFVLLEWVRRGKRISPRTEGLVHLIGLAMLMLLLVAITYQDIIRIISGESLIP